MKNPVRPELFGYAQESLVEGRAGFFIAQRVSMLWAVHASTLLSTNGSQHTPTALFRIIATRNRLIHGYLGIDNDTLWSIIQDDI